MTPEQRSTELAVVDCALNMVEDHPDVALHMVRDTQIAIDMGISDILWGIHKEGCFHPKEIKSYLLDMKGVTQ